MVVAIVTGEVMKHVAIPLHLLVHKIGDKLLTMEESFDNLRALRVKVYQTLPKLDQVTLGPDRHAFSPAPDSVVDEFYMMLTDVSHVFISYVNRTPTSYSTLLVLFDQLYYAARSGIFKNVLFLIVLLCCMI